MTPIARNAGGARSVGPPRRETALCVGLSAALHLAALGAVAMAPPPRGESSGGSTGAMIVTLVGSDAATVSETAPVAFRAPMPPADPEPAPEPEAVAAPAPAETSEPAAVQAPVAPPPPAVSAPATEAAPTPRPRPADLRPVTVEPTPQTAARQTTRAAGAGESAAAGSRGAAALSTGDAGAAASAMQTWQAQIQVALQRDLPLPRGAGRGGRDRRVVLALSVAPDGSLRGAQVLRSSGDAALDMATLRSVRRMGRLPRAPGGLNAAAYDFTAPIDLRTR